MSSTRSPGDPVEDSDGGEILAGFIERELTVERDRRTQINTRGGSIITTSASLATLLFAAAALVTGADKYVPPRLALWALALTFLCFTAASLCGLMAARQVWSDSVHHQQLELWRQDDVVWSNSKANVHRLIAKANILTLASLRAGSTVKANWVRYGHVVQLVALAALAVAVGAVLTSAMLPDAVGWLGLLRSAS